MNGVLARIVVENGVGSIWIKLGPELDVNSILKMNPGSSLSFLWIEKLPEAKLLKIKEWILLEKRWDENSPNGTSNIEFFELKIIIEMSLRKIGLIESRSFPRMGRYRGSFDKRQIK